MTGIDPAILEAAIKGLATAIGKVVGETGINLIGATKSQLLDGAGNLTQAAQDLLFRISKKYIANYTERHGTLKVLGMGKPVSLDSVYTNVNFQADIISCYQSLDAQEQVFRTREKEDRQKQPGLEVANEEQYLIVLGNPGTGKTTFLQEVGLEALKGKGNGEYHHPCIPVLLELRNFRSEEINIVQAIALEFQNCGLPEYQECTEELLKKGRLLILLDGLDEVPSDRLSEITTQIRNLIDCYSNNRFIVSCRIAAYRNFDNFRRFTDVAIADFDDEQIETFIGKWFESHSQPEWGQQCWEKLNSGEHNATKELTRTPLLLTLICILFKKRGEFPNKRATVYNEALWTLLSEWDASKEIVRSAPYEGMDTKCKEIMLAEIAYDNFVADNLFFQQVEITQAIEQILREMLPDERFIDGRAVLRAIEEQHGVLVSRANDTYSFSHLTLQEFLTAQHIVDNGIDIKDLVTNHLCDRRWQEVFLILAGLRRADELLLTMEQVINSLVDVPKLQRLLIWVERITDKTKGDIQPVGKRSCAIGYAKIIAYAHTITVANLSRYNFAVDNPDIIGHGFGSTILIGYAYTINNAHLAVSLVHEIAIVFPNAIDYFTGYIQWSEKYQIYQDVSYSELIATLKQFKQLVPKYSEPREVRQSLGKQMIDVCLQAFHLAPEIINLSKEEFDRLDSYLDANLLMVECKNSAVRVSPETWEGIESRMLLPARNI